MSENRYLTQWRTTERLRSMVMLVALAGAAALGSGRAEAIVLASPLAAALALALARTAPPDVRVDAAVSEERIDEGGQLTVEYCVTNAGGPIEIELIADVAPGLAVIGPHDRSRMSLVAGQSETFVLSLRADHWGTYEVGGALVRVSSPLALLRTFVSLRPAATVRVYPSPAHLRRLLEPRDTRPAIGNRLARAKGTGTEFADIRSFQTGDRARDVNWRISARRDGLWVNEHHLDRSADVALFIDAFDAGALGRAVRAADALAGAYLTQRDRVALVSFGGTLRTIRPGSGMRQHYAIVDALLSTRVFASAARRELRSLAPGTLAPRALVIALSPLDDERAVHALVELAARNTDLVVVQIVDDIGRDTLAARIWHLERAAARDALASFGVPCIIWPPDRAIGDVIEEISQWQRAKRAVTR